MITLFFLQICLLVVSCLVLASKSEQTVHHDICSCWQFWQYLLVVCLHKYQCTLAAKRHWLNIKVSWEAHESKPEWNLLMEVISLSIKKCLPSRKGLFRRKLRARLRLTLWVQLAPAVVAQMSLLVHDRGCLAYPSASSPDMTLCAQLWWTWVYDLWLSMARAIGY
jgi:hypothetical protein